MKVNKSIPKEVVPAAINHPCSTTAHVAHTFVLSLGLITPTPTTAPVQAQTVSPQKTIRNSQQIQKVTKAILGIFKEYAIPYDLDRRSIDANASMTPQEITGFDKLEDKIRNFVERGRSIDLYVVGFPFKSGNRDKKTIGHLPDMAERSSFVYLNKFLTRVNQIYSEGIRLTILCDGAAFSDILGIPDQHVVDYERTLCQLASDMPAIRFITSKQLIDGLPSFQAFRDQIDYMPHLSSTDQSELITTLKRLAFELDYEKGQRKIEHDGLELLTRALVLRGKNFSRLIEERFPEFTSMIKLTIHFQKDISKKFGIKLSPTSHITSWHGVLVADSDGQSTIQHKMDVDSNRFELTSASINGVWCPYFKAKKH